MARKLTKKNLPANTEPPATRAQLAGDSRAKGVIEHLLKARVELYAGCRDFCSVKGAAYHYHTMMKLCTQIDNLMHGINLDYAHDTRGDLHPFQLSLGRELTDAEVNALHGCSLDEEPTT